MTELFLEILNMSLSATWLVLAVVTLRFLLKKAPKWVNVLLWGLVAFRLLCPYTLESALSLIPSAEVISPEIMMDPTPTNTTGIDAVNRVVNPVITESFAPEPVASANPLQIWIPIAAIVWCIGMGLMLLYTVVSYARLRHKVRMAIRAKGNIYLSEFVDSPFVLGILRPRIYLPYHMSETDRHHVIAHERAHIRRRDHWWKPLGFLLLTIHWFNPAMWVAYILLCRDIELACDERVIKELGTDQRADYSQALLHCSVTHRSIAACPIAFGEVGVKERVKNVLRYQKPAFWVILICLVIILIVSVCFLTNPKEDSIADSDPFGHTYRVEEVVYQLSSIDILITAESAPVYELTADGQLKYKYDPDSEHWWEEGPFEPITLTEDNFDRYFTGPNDWSGTSKEELREENVQAWRLLTEPETTNADFYYLLQQQNGDLYITRGHYDQNYLDPEDELTGIDWVYQLKQDDSAGSSESKVQSLLGKTFQVSQMIYEDPRLSSTWLQVGIPFYSITQNCYLLTRDALPTTAPTDPPAPWTEVGQIEKLELTSDNFERYIRDDEGDKLAKKLRSDNQQAWQVITSDNVMYYLLRQKSGDLYLAYGTYDPEGEQDWASDDSTLSFIVQLTVSPDTDWAVAMTPLFISGSSASLSFRQVGTVADGTLAFGEDYSIERLVDGIWEELPHDPEKKVFSTVAYVIESDSHALDSFDWTDIYGELSEGHYRIRKTVTLSRAPGDSESRDYYAEFTIGGSEKDYVTLTLEDVSPTGATLYVQETVDDSMSLVYDGSKGYWLETLQDGQWVYLEPSGYVEPIFANEKRYIHALYYSSYHMELDWSHLYGELSPGTYRIAREVTYTGGSEPRIITVYGEFTVGSDWGIGLFIDRISENGITLSFLLDDSLQAGEYFHVGSTLQFREHMGSWTDAGPMGGSSKGPDIVAESPSFSLLWDEDLYQLTEGEHRIGVRIKHVLPDGTEEYNTIYEYFDPATYAWGISMEVTKISGHTSDLTVNYDVRFPQALPNGSISEYPYYRLQKRENNQWIEVEPKRPFAQYDQYHPVLLGSERNTQIALSATYSDLTNGTYRLVEDFTRHYPDRTTDTRPVYAIFAIDSNPALPNKLSACNVRDNGEDILTVTDPTRLETLRTLFANAEAVDSGPAPEEMTLGLTLVGSGGSTVDVLLDWNSDTCCIGGQYFDYGPGEKEDGRECLFEELLGISYTDLEVLESISTAGTSKEEERLRRALELSKTAPETIDN